MGARSNLLLGRGRTRECALLIHARSHEATGLRPYRARKRKHGLRAVPGHLCKTLQDLRFSGPSIFSTFDFQHLQFSRTEHRDCYKPGKVSDGVLMKVAIVVAGLIVVAVAALVAIQPSFLKPASVALVKKSDMFGFSPGMTLDETNKLVSQRRYLCRPGPGPYTLECEVTGAKVTVDGDETDPRHPIWRVNATLNNPGSQESAIRSISEQFNASAIKDREGWTWIVGRGFKLSYDGASLTLVDEAAEARLRKQDARR